MTRDAKADLEELARDLEKAGMMALATVSRNGAHEIDRLRAEVQKYKDKEAALFRMWNDPGCQ